MLGGIQAVWGQYAFVVNSHQLRPIIEGLALDSKLNVEQMETLESQIVTNVRNDYKAASDFWGKGNVLGDFAFNKKTDKQKSFKVKTQISDYTWLVNPVLEYNKWIGSIGYSKPFILDYFPYASWRMILKQVAMSNVTFGPDGNIIKCELELEFIEDETSNIKKNVEENPAGKANAGLNPSEKTAKAKEISSK